MKVTTGSKKTLLLLLIAVVPLAATLSGCVLPDYAAFLKTNGQTTGSDEKMITTSADPIVLQWDPPTTPVANYGVYFRIHGSTEWTKLAEVPADPQPSYSVSKATLGVGEFDFAVDAIDAAGDQSALHTSLDATADPTTGWYIQWQ